MMRTTIDGVTGGCVLSAALVLMGAAPLSAQARLPYGPVPVTCDRACLEGLEDQYLAALVAHAPKRLPLSADVRYTENDQLMPIGTSVPYHLNSPWQGGLSGK